MAEDSTSDQACLEQADLQLLRSLNCGMTFCPLGNLEGNSGFIGFTRRMSDEEVGVFAWASGHGG
ncbi:MAG: hypothetical protein ACREQE_00090, partial [Candidatus Binataceae bacterium]